MDAWARCWGCKGVEVGMVRSTQGALVCPGKARDPVGPRTPLVCLHMLKNGFTSSSAAAVPVDMHGQLSIAPLAVITRGGHNRQVLG